METIRVGGVPEHFNLPWHLAIENKLFENSGIKIEWVEFKGGTGAMTKALRENEIDVCVVLTEGIIADIAKGNPSKIIGQYINTPLIWGVYSGINNSIKHYGEIYDYLEEHGCFSSLRNSYSSSDEIQDFGVIAELFDHIFSKIEKNEESYNPSKNITELLTKIPLNFTEA